MDDKFKAAKFLFDKIKRLYQTFQIPDELEIEIWSEILEGYSQTTILNALKDYRKSVAYNTPPVPAEFKKYLASTEGGAVFTGDTAKFVAPAEQLMQSDIEMKRCRHFLPVYKQAVDYILSDLLLVEIPVPEWRKMNFDSRYITAKNKGLFSRFDEALVYVCRRDYDKDYQFDSEAMIESQNINRAFNLKGAAGLLGSHYRTDEATLYWRNNA